MSIGLMHFYHAPFLLCCHALLFTMMYLSNELAFLEHSKNTRTPRDKRGLGRLLVLSGKKSGLITKLTYQYYLQRRELIDY